MHFSLLAKTVLRRPNPCYIRTKDAENQEGKLSTEDISLLSSASATKMASDDVSATFSLVSVFKHSAN